MATLMLVNPRKRRASKKRRAPAARRARRTRRANPVAVSTVKRRSYRRARPGRARRMNPMGRTHRRIRRRRNPVSMRSLNGGSIMRMIKDAAVGGAGAIGMDLIMSKVNGMLPPSLQPSATGIGANDAVRVALTVLLGKFLSKATRGLSEKMAAGALTVQAATLMRPMLAKVVPGMAGIGYMVPNRVVSANSRIGPNIRQTVGAFTAPGSRSPLLAAYTRPGGVSPLLSGSARARESSHAR
jgi:hypothetical protein